MTDDMMSLRSLLEKTPDADLLLEMIGFAAQLSFGVQFLDADRGSILKAV